MKRVLSILHFLVVLYLFFLCIELMGGSFELLGKETAQRLLQVTDNPLVGLLLGILATSIMQSSSTTTSIVVGMAATQSLSIEQAIPIIMGANVGTTITNTIMCVGHMRLRKEFELAFAGASVHDFFNLCGVAFFLPLEIMFQPIQRTAVWIASWFVGVEGASFNSPLKAIVKPVVLWLHELGGFFIAHKQVLGVLFILVSLVLLIFALAQMVKIMRGAMAEKLEWLVDRYLFKSTGRALLVGIVTTALVQSSSVTTCIVVPLLGTGIVQLEAAFPYMVGANIGTTITAILASLVTGQPAALIIALCHLVFNLFATILFLPLKSIPIGLARMLSRATARRRWIAVVYVVVVFFGIPGILIFLL